jgi:hypothetical protein
LPCTIIVQVQNISIDTQRKRVLESPYWIECSPSPDGAATAGTDSRNEAND